MYKLHVSRSHWEKYSEMQEKVCLKLPDNFLGHSWPEWAALVEKDNYLNNVELHHWDNCARQLRIKGTSLAEGVCLFKPAVVTRLIGLDLIEVLTVGE